MRKVKPICEAITERKSVVYAEDKGCQQYKLNGLGRAAKPDRLFVTPNGYDWFVEFKRVGENPTRLQALEANELVNRHQLHSFIWELDEFIFKLNWILKLPDRKQPMGW